MFLVPCPDPFPGAPILQLLYKLAANLSQLHPSWLQRLASGQLGGMAQRCPGGSAPTCPRRANSQRLIDAFI